MNEYKNFSAYFDTIMDFLDYNDWINFTKENIKEGSSILDLACGSGIFLVNMNLYGYPTDGLDLSSQMIDLARDKMYINHINTNLYLENMATFNIDKKYDVITCYFDSINHLNTIEEVNLMFENVYKHLNKGGKFLFDVFSYSRFLEAEGTDISEEFEDFKYRWKMDISLPNTLHHHIYIDGNDKFEEEYDEHYYDYKELIKNKYFKKIKVVGDFNKHLYKTSERILVVLEKKDEN